MPGDPESAMPAGPPDPADTVGVGGYTGFVNVRVRHLGPMRKPADSKLRHGPSWKPETEEESEEPQGGSSR